MRLKILKEGSLLAGSTFLSILLSLYVILLLGGVGGHAVAGYGIGYSIIFVANRTLFGFLPGLIAAVARLQPSQSEFVGTVWMAVLAAAASGVVLALITAAGYAAYVQIVDLEAYTRRALDDYMIVAIWSLPFLGVGSALSGCMIRVGLVGRLFVTNLSLLTLQAIGITCGIAFGGDYVAPTKVPALTGLLSSLLAISVYLWVLVRSGILDLGLPKIDIRKLQSIWTNSLSSGADAVVIAVTFMLVAMIASQLGTQEAAATATIITLLRLAIIPCKSFGIITGRLATAAFAKYHHVEGTSVIRSGIQLMYMLLTPVAFVLIAGHARIAEFLWPDIPAGRAETLSILLVLAGLQILMEPVAGFLSTILKTLNRGAQVLGNTALYQWIVAVPAAYVTALHFDLGVVALWLCMVCGRLIFTGLCLLAWRASDPTRVAANPAPIQR